MDFVEQAHLEASHNKRVAKILAEADVDEDSNGKCKDFIHKE